MDSSIFGAEQVKFGINGDNKFFRYSELEAKIIFIGEAI